MTASQDKTIMLWTTSLDDVTHSEPEPTVKKRKTLVKPAGKKECESVFEQHTDSVTSVVFADSQSFYSGGFDHTVRKWDIESGNNTRTMVSLI